MFAKYKKIIITVLVLVLGFIVWSIFIKADPEPESFLINDQPRQVDKIGEEIITALNRMKSLELDKSVFEHPIFIRLEDYSREITPNRVGRPNPFDNIGSNVSSNTTSQTNNTPEDDANIVQ